MTTLATAFIEVRPDTKMFGTLLKRDTMAASAVAGSSAGDKMGSSFKSKMATVAKVGGLALGAAAAVGAVSFVRKSGQLEAAFSKTMNQFQASTDLSAAGMKRMQDLALKMGADTVFSASDASEAMLALAKSGIKPAAIEAGALQSALTLASAGELDMATAAETMGNALNTFGLKAKDAASVSAALAGAANASSASVHSIATGLSQAGTVAADAGFTIQETTGAIAALAQAGIAGSDAGTSLKTMFSALVPQTAKAFGVMQQYGLVNYDANAAAKTLAGDGIKAVGTSYEDTYKAVEKYMIAQGEGKKGTVALAKATEGYMQVTGIMRNSFLKQNGDFKSLGSIAGTLKDKLSGLSDSERASALSTMFGSDARRAATILMKEGTKGLAKYVKATSDQGAAEKMAAAGMKGTAGAAEALKGSWETLQLEFGLLTAPAREKAMRVLTSAVNAIVPAIKGVTGFVTDNSTAFKALGATIAAVTVVTMAHTAVLAIGAAGGLAAWIAGTRVAAVVTKAWAAGQWLLNAAMSANPLALAVKGLFLVGAALVYSYKKFEGFRKVVDTVFGAVVKSAKWLWNVLFGHSIFPDMLKAFKAVFSGIGKVIAFWWKNVVKPYFKAVGAAARFLWNNAVKPIFNAWKLYLTKVLFPVLRFLWERVAKPVFTALGKKIREVWDNWVRPAFQNLREGIGKVKDAFGTAVAGIKKAWEKIKSVVKKPINAVINIINAGIIGPFNKVSGALDGPKIGPIANFDSGGYTGPGSRMQPAGIVHADEFVVSSPARRKIERRAPGLLDEMNHGKLSRLPGYWLGGGVTPMAGATSISRHSGYGWAKWAGDLNGAGDDTGKTVRAWKSGIVAAVQHLTSSYGNNIRVNHAGSERTLYAHLSRILVNGGQKVGAGQKIGEVGSTGNSTGPHLHFELAGGSNAITGGTGGGGGAAQKVVSFLSTLGSGIKNAVTNPLAFFKDKVGGPIKGMLDRFGNSKMAQMVAGVPRTLIGAAADKIKSLFGFAEKKYNKQNLATSQMFNDPSIGSSSSSGGGLSPSQAQAAGRQMIPPGWSWPALLELWNRESGWRWNATGSMTSNGRAYGIPQSLPGSKMASAGADWRTNAITQMRWGLGYIGDRYGNSGSALAHSDSHGWYDAGGVARGRGYIPKGTSRPERVLSPRQTESFDRLVDLLERRTLGGGKVRLVVRGREFDAYIEDVADGRISDTRANDRMRHRGGARV